MVVEARGASSSGRVDLRARASAVRATRACASSPAPRPRALPDRHVFVSTEIGPVLVLTGKADAATTAERADRVAAAAHGADGVGHRRAR